jgi:hypothetical protein
MPRFSVSLVTLSSSEVLLSTTPSFNPKEDPSDLLFNLLWIPFRLNYPQSRLRRQIRPQELVPRIRLLEQRLIIFQFALSSINCHEHEEIKGSIPHI